MDGGDPAEDRQGRNGSSSGAGEEGRPTIPVRPAVAAMTHRVDMGQGDDAYPGQHARLLDGAGQTDDRPTSNESQPSTSGQDQVDRHDQRRKGQADLEPVIVHAADDAQGRQGAANPQPEGMIGVGAGIPRQLRHRPEHQSDADDGRHAHQQHRPQRIGVSDRHHRCLDPQRSRRIHRRRTPPWSADGLTKHACQTLGNHVGVQALSQDPPLSGIGPTIPAEQRRTEQQR